MSKTLLDFIAWADNVNARSSKDIKRYQSQLVETINKARPDMTGPEPMSVCSPTKFSVVTKGGTNTVRHFIGGEELILSRAVITPRSYALLLEFTPVSASDIEIIKIPLIKALSLVSGLEIRMMATPISTVAGHLHLKITEEKETRQIDRLDNQYSTIGYGSW